jgi:glycosyltransferase involved in cell wall biosynthesis
MAQSMRLRTRRFVRRQVADTVATITERLPGDGLPGPAAARPVVARALLADARLALRSERDPGKATRLITRVLKDDLSGTQRSEAYALLAEVRRTSGDQAGAREAAATAVASVPVAFSALVERQRVLGNPTGPDDTERHQALAAVLGQQPRNRKDLDLALAVLPYSTLAEIDAYRARLASWGREGLDTVLAEATQEVTIVEATDLDAAVATATETLLRPLPVVTRALVRRAEWEMLADWVDAHPVNRAGASVHIAAAALELRRAAGTALKKGRARIAQRLAAHALALAPDDSWARETWTTARDLVDVVDHGWRFTPVNPTRRYLPRPDAVLSVLAQSMPHTSGGYATRTHGVLTGLAARGWDVRAVTRPGFPYDRWASGDRRVVDPVDVVDGITYQRILTQDRRYPQFPLQAYIDRYTKSLEVIAREHRPAVIHASSFHVNGLAAQAVAAKLGVPFVYEMRGLEELMKISRDPGFVTSERHAFTESLETGIAQHADRVFVITNALRELMIERGVAADKLVVLPNGVHTDRFERRPRDPELAAELGVTDKIVIGYAGGLVDYEGLDLLLRAVHELVVRRDDLHLVVVGDGPVEGRLHALSSELGLDRHVTFTGRVPHDDVARYLSLVDIAPFPRLPLPVCEAISPIKPFESMAMGKAVIVSSVAALTEIVDDGNTGLVFTKGSASDLARVIERYADDPELRSRMGEAARTWVRAERDWSHITGIVDDVYAELVPAASAPATR